MKCKEFRHLQRVSTCGVCAVSETDIIEKKESDMRVMLLAAAGSLAALAAGTGPAAAQQFAADGFSGGHHGRHGGFIDGQRFDRDFACGLRDRSLSRLCCTRGRPIHQG